MVRRRQGREAPVRSQAGSVPLLDVGQKDWSEKSTQLLQPYLHSAPTLIPLPSAGPGRGPSGQGPKEAPGWAGREVKGGQHRGGSGQEEGSKSKVGPSLSPGLLPHPPPSALLLSGGAVTALLTTSPATPAAASCNQLCLAGRRTLSVGSTTGDPAPFELRSGEQARRAGLERPSPRSHTTGSAWPGTELVQQTSGSGLLPRATVQTVSASSPAGQVRARRRGPRPI